MTKEDIRKAYLDCIEEDIQRAEMYANDPMFDKLREVCNSPYGYNLFHPMSDGWGAGLAFNGLCDLYNSLKYCWDDDGDTSFVHAVISVPMWGEDRSVQLENSFVMYGDMRELHLPHVEKQATKHSSNAKLVSYVATRFKPATLDWLHTLIHEWNEIEKLGKADGMDAIDPYFKACMNMDKVFEKYIRESKYMTEVKV